MDSIHGDILPLTNIIETEGQEALNLELPHLKQEGFFLTLRIGFSGSILLGKRLIWSGYIHSYLKTLRVDMIQDVLRSTARQKRDLTIIGV